MADEIDRAQGINEAHQREALAAHRRRRQQLERFFAPTACEDCGEPIPEARQQASPGCIRCVGCQGQHETTQKRGFK